MPPRGLSTRSRWRRCWSPPPTPSPAARPGARREILESYIKRLEKLEGLAGDFKGVDKAFAIQAGRELRIIVENEKISDEDAMWLARDVAKKIEAEADLPGPDQGDRHPRDSRRGARSLIHILFVGAW